MGVRLKNFLMERLNLQFERLHFYTDSMVAYHWAMSAKPVSYKTFVCNRVREIQENSRREDWYHVQGDSNISDIATRGITAEALTACQDWWEGPKWLRLPAEQRPISRPQAGSGANCGCE